MKKTAQNFYSLRVYRNLSTSAIFNLMLCNRLMKLKPLVSNASKIYKYSNRIFGSSITNFALNQTFCKALTAGNTLTDANLVSNKFRNDGIPIILDYCAEGEIGTAGAQIMLDQNAKMFAKSAEAIYNNQSQMISIKITGLVDMDILRRMNDAVNDRDKFWSEYSQNGYLAGERAFLGLQKKYSGISDGQFSKYLKDIFKFQGKPQEFKVDEVEFKMNHHPFYFGKNVQTKNEDFVIRLFFPLNSTDKKKLDNLQERLSIICQPYANNKTDFKILVDAQQSYVQKAIESISQQLQETYNKQQLFIIPTVQNYLKRSVQRTKYEVQIAKRKNLYFGAKLVRGAYIVQETNLSKKHGYENPVVDGFEKTTENYLGSFKQIINNHEKGQVIVATHNQDTILSTSKLYNDKHSQNSASEKKLRLSYAQLLGLADHLTYQSKKDGFRVYKYLPWAKVEVMIGYMIRRAQQLSQMKYPLDAQYQLLKQQLKKRFLG